MVKLDNLTKQEIKGDNSDMPDHCLYCSAALETASKAGQTSHYCEKCLKKLGEYADQPSAPALHGLSDGPGTSQLCFDKPNAYKETLQAAKDTEAAGKMNPQREQFFKAKLKQLEPTKDKKIDYQKTGHRLDH